MAKVVPFAPSHRQPIRLTAHEAQKVIRAMAQDSKSVFVVPHGRRRKGERGISRRQVMTCLHKGIVTEGPFVNIHGNWQVNLSRFAAGEAITCAVAIEWETRLIVITVFRG